MNTLRKFAAAIAMLTDAGLDPLAGSSVVDLGGAIIDKCTKIDADTPPSEILAIIRLVDALDATLDRLAATHQAPVNTGAAA